MDTGVTPIVYRPSLLQKKTKAYTLSRLKTPVCSGFLGILGTIPAILGIIPRYIRQSSVPKWVPVVG